MPPEPSETDPELLRLLRRFIVITAACVAVVLLLNLTFFHARFVWQFAAMGTLLLGCLGLSFVKGMFRLTAVLTTLGTMIAETAIFMSGAQIGAPVYLTIVVAAALFLGRPGVVAFTGLSIAAMALVLALRAAGLIQEDWLTDLGNLTSLSVIIGLGGLLVWLLVERLEKAARQARSLTEDLRRMNETLSRRVEEEALLLKATQEKLTLSERLVETQERFRQLAATINEVFWLTDVNKESMLYISPAYEKIWGRTPQSLIESPRNWLAAIHEDDRERVLEAELTKQMEGTFDETYRIVRPDGSVRWIRDRAFPVRNAEGDVYRIAGVATDITEVKVAAEHEVRLENELHQAQKLEGLGTLASGLAHDFNNLLAIILGHVSILESSAPNPERLHKSLDAIRKAGFRGASLVKQILTFARRAPVAYSFFPMGQLVQEFVAMARETFPRNIEFVVRADPDLPKVFADATQVHQVLLNLSVNARDAMPEGGRLEISLSLEEGPEKRFLALEVADSGVGMDKDTLERIFEPFFTTKGEGTGTGLGLSVVFGILEAHQGSVEVHSEVGRGTKFRCLFPVQEQSPEPVPVAGMGDEAYLPHDQTILLVDDEVLFQDVVAQYLRTSGFQVVLATNGQEALEAFCNVSNQVSLVLTDLNLPGMNGEALIREIVAIDPRVPICVMSGYIEPGLERRLPKGLRLERLSKPFELTDLLQALGRLLTPT